jgi:ubiquinone/menaquinone biosynthesis C-methylase UbiE
LREMRRTLKTGGKLLFVELGLSPEPAIERWHHRLTPNARQQSDEDILKIVHLPHLVIGVSASNAPAGVSKSCRQA